MEDKKAYYFGLIFSPFVYRVVDAGRGLESKTTSRDLSALTNRNATQFAVTYEKDLRQSLAVRLPMQIWRVIV